MTKKIEVDYLLITHRIYQNKQPKLGGLDRTKEFLIKKGKRVVMIENPITIFGEHLVLGYKTFIKLLFDNNEQIVREFKIFPTTIPLIWISEIFYNCFFIKKYFQPKFKCICADPLSFLSGHVLKRLGYINKVIFHVTDYSDKRFENKILSLVYFYIFKFCLKKADLVLAVSGRMIDRFKEIYPQGKYFYFPNSPDFESVPRKRMTQRKKQSLVIMGLSIKGMEYENILKAIKKLKPQFPKIKFKVIGSGGAERDILKLAKKYDITESVIIYGFLPRDRALELISSSGIGIVIYKDVESFHYYRDSLKIREYAACGLPIITDHSTFTSEEAERFGACVRVNNDVKEIVNAIQLLLKDEKAYNEYSQNAIEWAKTFDKKVLLNRIID